MFEEAVADGPDAAQLLTVPPNAFAFFVIIGNAWHSDRKKERPAVSRVLHCLRSMLICSTSWVV
jgi:hypothetical protein